MKATKVAASNYNVILTAEKIVVEKALGER